MAALNDACVSAGVDVLTNPVGESFRAGNTLFHLANAGQILIKFTLIASTQLAIGDTVEAVIINVDRKTRNINLSIKAKDQAEETSAIKQMQDAGNAKDGTTNLGALLKAKMEQK